MKRERNKEGNEKRKDERERESDTEEQVKRNAKREREREKYRYLIRILVVGDVRRNIKHHFDIPGRKNSSSIFRTVLNGCFLHLSNFISG